MNPAFHDWPVEIEDLSAIYNLVPVLLNIKGYPVQLVKVENIDDLLDRVNDPDEIPFWAELWPAAIGMATFILQNSELFAGKKVLELGAGVGLSGIAAKIAGAEVVQSDFSADALRFTQVNCQRNGVAVGATLLADWRTFPDSAGRFDMMIGADILYEKTLHSHLSRIFEQHLQPGGAVWLADPGREFAKLFMTGAAGRWQVYHCQVPVNYQGKNSIVDLYRLT